MTLGLMFWILMLIWLVFGLASTWPGSPVGSYWPIGNMVLLFMLFLLLGWHAFGPPIRG